MSVNRGRRRQRRQLVLFGEPPQWDVEYDPDKNLYVFRCMGCNHRSVGMSMSEFHLRHDHLCGT